MIARLKQPRDHRGGDSTVRRVKLKRIYTLTGSFCGPQAALLFSWSKPGTLILFTVMAATAGGLCFRLPDTKDVPTPSTAQQVRNTMILTIAVRLRI